MTCWYTLTLVTFSLALTISADDASDYVRRASRYLHDENYSAAAVELEKALGCDLSDYGYVICYWHLGVCARGRRQFDKELTWLRKFVAVAPRIEHTAEGRSFDVRAKLMYAQARIHGRISGDLNELLAKARRLADDGDVYAAERVYLDALLYDLSDSAKVFVYAEIFSLFAQSGVVAKASEYARRVVTCVDTIPATQLAATPALKDAYTDARAYVLRQEIEPYYTQARRELISGNITDALAHAQAACQRATAVENRFTALALLGDALFDAGRYTEAKAAFDQCAGHSFGDEQDEYVSLMCAALEPFGKSSVP